MHGDDFQAELEGRQTYVAELDGAVAGWASAGWNDGTWWLDDLWVLPDFMRRGVGKALFEHVVAQGRELGAKRLEWETDPNATGFYDRLGAVRLGATAASLPLYALEL